AMAGENSSRYQLSVFHGIRHRLGQRAAVTNASGAPVPDQVEPEFGQRREQCGLAQVFSDDLRAGREACLDVRRHLQPAFEGFLRQQSRADQEVSGESRMLGRAIFDKEARKKPLALAADVYATSL